MKRYIIGILGAVTMTLGCGLAQAEPLHQTPNPAAQTAPAPATPRSDLSASEPKQILPPQTSNSEAKEDNPAADADNPALAEPGKGITISEFYNRDVYDAQDNKIGSVKDAMLDQTGQVKTVILGVGGLLGLGEKDVAVPFNAIQVKIKDGKRYLITDTTKEALQEAPGYTYDRDLGQWVPAKQPG